MWRLHGPLHATATLEGLVDERLHELGADERAAMEILAVAGGLGVDLLAGLVGENVIDRLDERGLVAVRSSGRRNDVAVAHPLYAEVLAARLPRLRGRRIRQHLAGAVQAAGGRRREDGVRITSWRLEGGGPVEAALLVRSARLALLQRDLPTAERLARRAYDDGGFPEAAQVLSEIHYRRGEFERMEDLLRGVDVRGADDRLRAELARRRANGLFYGLGLLDEPLGVLDQAVERLTDPAARLTLESHRAMILAFGGLVDQAVEATKRLLDRVAGPDRFEVVRARTLALAMAGRGEEALSLAEEGRRLHAALESELGTPGLSVLLFSHATALTELGRFHEARAMIEEDFRGRPEATTRNWLRFAGARLELATGSVPAGREAIAPLVTESRGMGLETVERWALMLLTMLCVLDGELEEARDHLQRARAIRVDPPQAVVRYDSDRAEAWILAAAGALPDARRRLMEAAEHARHNGVAAQETALLHDIVRFGDAGAVSERLATVARTMQGELVAVRAAHALAIAEGDVDALCEVSKAFERLDAPLWAAESAAQLAMLRRQRGESVAAEEAALRSKVLSERTGGILHSPALAAVDLTAGRRSGSTTLDEVVVGALSAREMEVAILAAGGLSSRVIAERLFLSVRTVDNHLQRVYAKLGVNARDQLASALATSAAPPPDTSPRT